MKAMKHFDPNILVLIIGANTSTGTTFVYCYIGSLTTEIFFLYGDISYESDWYKLPIEQQKLLQLIIADAQRPQIFHGFGIIESNLTTFIKVDRYSVSLESNHANCFPGIPF